MTQGLIPHTYEVSYGQIRDRVKKDGKHWLQPELKAFFDEKLVDNNEEWSKIHKWAHEQASKTQDFAMRVLQRLHIKR